MIRCVLDCSAAAGWWFKDESTPSSDRLLESLARDSVMVPAIWHLELANALVAAEARRRLKKTDAAQIAAFVESLPILVDTETPRRALRETLHLARSQGLTAYDAAYLELAMRKKVPLATKDALLQRAATKLGVKLLEM